MTLQQEIPRPAPVADNPPRPVYRLTKHLPDLPIFAELKQRAQWVAWDYEWKPKKNKWDKVPKNPAGGNASVSDPATWGSYDAAFSCAQRRRFAGVGFVLTEGDDITGIDLDKCVNPAAPWFKDLISKSETYGEISPSDTGGRLFARGGEIKTLKNDKAGVEIYTQGRFLTITGNHLPGTPTTIEPAPATLAALVARVEEFKPAKPKIPISQKASAHFKIETASGPNKFWRNVNNAALDDLDAWVPALFPQAQKHPTGAWRVASADLGRDLEEDLSIHPSGVQDFGEEEARTAIDLVKDFGHAPDAKAAADWLCEKLGKAPATLGWTETKSPARAIAQELNLVTDKTGRPFWNTANAVEILSAHAEWQGVFGFNEFTRRRVVLKRIPGSKTGANRNLEDDDATAVLSWFNRNGFPRATANVAIAAVHAVARRQSFDPLKDYLKSLTWDGTPRINKWLITYCGAEATEYTQEVGRRWLISAAARAFKPGCKADHMLVLEGEQGARKSSALAALAGEDWFSDALPPMNTKDASSYLRGRWIVEVAELEAMRREMDAVKAFISRQTESYRPAYGREEVDEPRRCIFAGTTNKDTWLRDETGGRRFWPIRVGEIDLDGIKRDRGQLWAEAVAAFNAKERWWLDGDTEAEARNEQSARMADDPWLDIVETAVRGRDKITIREILFQMNMLPTEMKREHSDRVASILRRLGWQRHQGQRMTAGEFKGQAVYTAPK